MLGVSSSTAAMLLSTATTKNCSRLSRTPSTCGAKWSMERIWKLNSTAQSSRTRSLASMPPKPFFMQSRYSPATEMTMLTQSCGLFLRPSASPNTGTSTTYIAVRKADFAVEFGLRVMPICCAADAANSKVPQIRLAFRRVFSCSPLGQPQAAPCLRRSASKAETVGSSTTTASQLRPARKE